MRNLYFQAAGNVSGVVKSHEQFVFGEKEQCLAKAYIPGFTPVEGVVAELAVEINHTAEEQGWNNEMPLETLLRLYGMLRPVWIERGMYPVHAACIARKEKRILLVGHSGSGKSTVILKLMEQGDLLISGNKTLVEIQDGSLHAVGGTETITVKASEREKYEVLAKQIYEYWGRVAFEVKTKTAPERKIDAIMLLRLNDGAKEHTQLSAESALHKLYPFFLDVVNANIIYGQVPAMKVLAGDITQGARERLVTSLSQALKTTPVYEVQGSLEFITDHIKKL